MPIVKAIQSFDHDGPVKRGQRMPVSQRVADQLIARGLVERTGEKEESPNPQIAAGAEQVSSASPVAQASPQTTAKKSARGARAQPQQTDGLSLL